MMRQRFIAPVLLVFGVLLVVTSSAQQSTNSLMTESERYLKQMVTYVTPLMAILRKDQLRVKRQIEGDPIDRDSYGYGGGGYESSYEPCCDDKQDYVAILSIVALGLLFLFLIALLSTTTSSGRKKRDEGDDLSNFIEDLNRHDASNNFFSFFFFFQIIIF